MGNYIYGYITPKSTNDAPKSTNDAPKSTNGMPKSTNGNQTATIHIDVHAVKSIVEDIKSDVTTNEVTIAEANIDEKSIHPYLLEYGTGIHNHMIINNNVYKYETPN